jgi:hypothetical protein
MVDSYRRAEAPDYWIWNNFPSTTGGFIPKFWLAGVCLGVKLRLGCWAVLEMALLIFLSPTAAPQIEKESAAEFHGIQMQLIAHALTLQTVLNADG